MVQDQVTEMQQRVRSGVYLMVKEMRVAGYDPNLANVAGITTADPDELEFTFVSDDDGEDNDGDATVDEPNELKTIKFDTYDAYGDGTNDIGRTVGGTTRVLIEDIEELEFYYTLEDGTQLTNPTAAQHEDIRTVQINILVRAGEPDDEFSGNYNYSYLTDSGTAWGPYNDKLRRRLLTSTVQFRNLGLNLI
jgi:type IV pilus assembly protein PilW